MDFIQVQVEPCFWLPTKPYSILASTLQENLIIKLMRWTRRSFSCMILHWAVRWSCIRLHWSVSWSCIRLHWALRTRIISFSTSWHFRPNARLKKGHAWHVFSCVMQLDIFGFSLDSNSMLVCLRINIFECFVLGLAWSPFWLTIKCDELTRISYRSCTTWHSNV
jgi:hypothetical protein